MTTIAAIRIDDVIHMGADTRTVGGSGRVYKTDLKIKHVGAFLLGGAGNSLPLDTILYGWTPPTPSVDDYRVPYAFFVNKVVPSMKEAISATGYVKATVSLDDGFEFLIAFDGELYNVDDDWCTSMFTSNVGSCGTGGDVALGALLAGADIRTAMKLAAQNDQYTAPPFTFLTQRKAK